jgi:tryptophan synthase beta subunit
MGIFSGFVDEAGTRLVGVEPAGGAAIGRGTPGEPITQLNMDEKGFEKYIRTERRTTKILNNRFRS